ncbi:putative receptor like protein 25 [Ziziphus jujuba]|uniref:Receptor like protein 25 n=1 Tax=Ziziphus jujuba TaxID=326968 RepID=A0ABM4A2C1_ZIZJJ|nr:putative receptor like protein 25 [Ziziphus jujuba]
MTQVHNHNHYRLYGGSNGYYEENFVVTTKNQHLEFTKSLSLVVSLDLSGNNLNGDLPGEITNLLGVVFLNLSRNHISGHIPESISRLTQLSSLDLSHNTFSGAIPQSLGSLSFLGYLNLSDNDFTGKIPHKDQMITFSASSYVGNHGLCGSPLDVKCPGDEDDDDTNKGSTIHKDNSNGDSFIDNWFYLSVGLGFAAGIIIPFMVMSIRKSWSVAYFDAVEEVSERILYLWLSTLDHKTTERMAISVFGFSFLIDNLYLAEV